MEMERWAIMSVLDHLQKASEREGMNRSSLQEAIMGLSNAYSLNFHNAATRERYPMDGMSFIDIFSKGREALKAQSSKESQNITSASSSAMDVDSSNENDGFSKLLKRLHKTTYFNGADKGTEEYERRLLRARERYDAKLKSKSNSTPAKTARAAPGPTVTAEDKAKAEELKAKGNTLLKEKNYLEAHEMYCQSIELDPNNAVFYSNRAAAKMLLQRYPEAIDDCKSAIDLDPNFARPRERLAAAYRYMGNTKGEIDALKGLLQLDPTNENVKGQLQTAESHESGAASSAPGQADALSGMARQMGLNLPDGMLDNFINGGGMAQMQNMMQNNPEMIQQAMQAFGGAFGGGNQGANGGANPNS